MKISLKHYDQTATIEIERDEVTLTEAMQLCFDLLVASGFSKDGIIEILEQDGDGNWVNWA